MNVPNFPEGKRPKATDVSPWYGVYLFKHMKEGYKLTDNSENNSQVNGWSEWLTFHEEAIVSEQGRVLLPDDVQPKNIV